MGTVALIAANLGAWALLLIVRAPLPAEYFAERDPRLNAGRVHWRSTDPPLVIAGRPLFDWSEHHGGEHALVKVLEALNLIPLAATALIGALLLVAVPLSLEAHSDVLAVVLAALVTAQWWLAGSAARSFRAFQAARRSAGAS